MSILDNAKEVAKAVQEINNLELYQRVIGLHSDIIALVEENNRLRKDISDLREQLTIIGELELDRTHNGYYRVRDGKKDGPFCAVCWDVDKRLVNMHYSPITAHNIEYAKRTGNQGLAQSSPYSCTYCSSCQRSK